jgi:YD repeat-containing protein
MALASAINACSSVVNASASGTTVNLTAKTGGAATNYSLSSGSSTSQPGSFSSPSFSVSVSGAALTGGHDAGPVTYDTGSVWVTVNGTQYPASYGQGSTATSLASAIANAMNAGSLVSAIVSGSSISITAKSAGASTNYSLSSGSSTSQSGSFSSPSFSVSVSGLTGGTDGTPGSLATPAVTLYIYDTLGNLTCVVQKGTDTSPFTNCAAAPAVWRPRSFAYNSLSQLLSASNPESGITYAYDADGNMISKTAPAPNQTGSATVTTTYSYDALNRLTQKSFSDGTTPSVTYTYDISTTNGVTLSNPVGRLVKAETAGSTYNYIISGYDSMGRVQIKYLWNAARAATGACCAYVLSSQYNLLGAVSSDANPFFTLSQQFDGAGRVTQLTSSLVDAQHPATLAAVDTSFGYHPTGATARRQEMWWISGWAITPGPLTTAT